MQRLISKLPPHKALIAFEAVLRLGTVTAAAKELTSTQPAISQHLKSLEANLNTTLFERKGRGLQPTSEALSYYQEIEPLLLKIAEASELLRQSKKESRTVNIVSNGGLAHFWLLPLLPELQMEFPDITLKVTLSDSAETPSSNAIVMSFGRLNERASQQTLFVEQVCAVCSAEHAVQHGLNEHSSVDDIVRQPLIHMDEDERRWLNWRDWLKHNNYQFKRPDNVVLLGNYYSVIGEVQKGRGIALGWLCLMQHLIDQKQLVQVGDKIVARPNYGYYIDHRNSNSPDDLRVCKYLLNKALSISVS